MILVVAHDGRIRPAGAVVGKGIVGGEFLRAGGAIVHGDILVQQAVGIQVGHIRQIRLVLRHLHIVLQAAIDIVPVEVEAEAGGDGVDLALIAGQQRNELRMLLLDRHQHSLEFIRRRRHGHADFVQNVLTHDHAGKDTGALSHHRDAIGHAVLTGQGVRTVKYLGRQVAAILRQQIIQRQQCVAAEQLLILILADAQNIIGFAGGDAHQQILRGIFRRKHVVLDVIPRLFLNGLAGRVVVGIEPDVRAEHTQRGLFFRHSRRQKHCQQDSSQEKHSNLFHGKASFFIDHRR